MTLSYALMHKMSMKFVRHILTKNVAGRILAERFYAIGTLRSNFLLQSSRREN